MLSSSSQLDELSYFLGLLVSCSFARMLRLCLRLALAVP